MATKGYKYPLKIKIALAKIFSWFGKFIVSQLTGLVKKKIRRLEISFKPPIIMNLTASRRRTSNRSLFNNEKH